MRKETGIINHHGRPGRQTGSGAGGMTPLESASTPQYGPSVSNGYVRKCIPHCAGDSVGHGCGPSADIRL